MLRRLIDAEYPNISAIAEEVRAREVEYVLIAARGTSDNAATFAKYLFGTMNRLPVALAAPSLYTVYGSPPRLRNALVLAISQSGMSPDIVSVVKDARRQGMFTIALTNTPGSALARAAERTILCRAGEERSVAATKTYTAQLTALAMLSVALSEDEERLRSLREVPKAVAEALALNGEVSRHVGRYRDMDRCVVISRGYNYATAFEIALKVKELSCVVAEPYSSADFVHGPIALLQPGFVAFVIAPGGRVFPDMLRFLIDAKERGAYLIVISDREQALELAQTPLPLPVSLDEWLSPIAAVVPGQLFAYHLALEKGLDPEHPRGLQKVTLTR
ncbi:MAG TPA: SIS domain-containing protein [Anaerolineae bacterium]|nr:SIS domain-containing protein [Anaerolineae bacterium]